MSRAIGVFDSGVGGLTVLRELLRVLPQESTIYLGDNARVPYGGLRPETIRRYTLECLDYLWCEGVKALVIACNTATAAALPAARARYPVPVIGVIDATAQTAARVSRGLVGVLGTEATVSSGEYPRAILSRRTDVDVFQHPCPRLAGLVEVGELSTPRTEMVLDGYLQPLRELGVDTLVLGCTHYGFLRRSIRRLMGPEVKLVECGPSVVAALAELMEEGSLERAGNEQATHRLLTTGEARAFRRVARVLWSKGSLEIEEVAVEKVHGAVRREAA